MPLVNVKQNCVVLEKGSGTVIGTDSQKPFTFNAARKRAKQLNDLFPSKIFTVLELSQISHYLKETT